MLRTCATNIYNSDVSVSHFRKRGWFVWKPRVAEKEKHPFVAALGGWVSFQLCQSHCGRTQKGERKEAANKRRKTRKKIEVISRKKKSHTSLRSRLCILLVKIHIGEDWWRNESHFLFRLLQESKRKHGFATFLSNINSNSCFLVPCQQCREERRLRLKYESDDILMFFLPNFLPNDNWIFHFPSSLQNPHFVCFPLEESQAVNLCSIRMVTVKTKLARPKSFNKGVIQWNSVELPP